MQESFLITLATGRQGFSTAIELLKHDKMVHALVRNKDSAAAKSLETLGCVLFEGSPDDKEVIEAAIAGVTGIFINIFPDFQDAGAELRQVNNLLAAAVSAPSVTTVVVTTALNTSKHPQWLAKDPNYPMAYYYGHKHAIENAVRTSDIRYRTILRPAWLMHDYLEPLWRQHYPNYQTRRRLDVAYPRGTKTAHFDASDVGKFAAAAFLDPLRFHGDEIELGNEQLTIEDVAGQISLAVGVEVGVNYLSADDVAAIAPQYPALAMRRWGIKEGAYINDPARLRDYKVGLTSFAEFTQREVKGFKEALLVVEN